MKPAIPDKIIKIRPVEREEEQLFRQMVFAYWQDVIPGSFTLSNSIQAEAMFQDRYRWIGKNNRPFWAMIEGAPVGFFMVRFFNHGAAAYIHDFFIEKQSRRLGYGSQLFSIVAAWLSEKGVRQLELSVQAGNHGASRFWSKRGFRTMYSRLSRELPG